MNTLTNILNEIYNNSNNSMNNANLWKTLINELNTGKEQQLFISYIERTLSNHPDNELTLDLLDYVVDNGGYQIVQAISAQQFLTSFANFAVPGSQVPSNIQRKILYLISKWGNRYNINVNNPFPTFIDLYNYLLGQGISFPQDIHSTYYQYTDSNYLKYKDTNQEQEKLTKVTNIANIWIKKLIDINQMIDQGKYGINSEKLKIEMNNLNYWKEKVNIMIGKYYEQSNIREIFINLKRDIDITCLRYERLLSNEQLMPFVSSFKQFNENSGNSNNSFYSYYSFDKFDKEDFNGKQYPFNNPKLDGEHIKKEFHDLGDKIKKPFDKMSKDMNEKFGKIKTQWDSYDPNSNMNINKENKHGYFDNAGHLHEHKPILVKMKNGFNKIQKAFDKIGKK